MGRSGIIGIAFGAVLLGAAQAPCRAQEAAEASCDAALLERLKTAEAQILVCMTSARLVPGEPVVFVVWSYDRQSPNAGLALALFDLAGLRQGSRKALFQMLRGQELLPIRQDGETGKVAFGDFDHSGHMGWAVEIRDERESVLLMRAYDPKSGRFQPIGPWRRSEEGMVTQDGFPTEGEQIPEIADGAIKLSTCRRDPSRAYGKRDLYFDLYRLVDGRYALADETRDPLMRYCPAE